MSTALSCRRAGAVVVVPKCQASSLPCRAQPAFQRTLLAGLACVASVHLLMPAIAVADEPRSTGLDIIFSPVTPEVRDKLRARDENLRWKCLGVNMFDCDGERAAQAEATSNEIRQMFKKN